METNKANSEKNGFMACPFCGRTDKVVVMEEDFFYRLQGEHGAAVMTVKCERCNAEMSEHTWSVKKYEKRVDILRKKWNKRTEVQDGKKTE